MVICWNYSKSLLYRSNWLWIGACGGLHPGPQSERAEPRDRPGDVRLLATAGGRQLPHPDPRDSGPGQEARRGLSLQGSRQGHQDTGRSNWILHRKWNYYRVKTVVGVMGWVDLFMWIEGFNIFYCISGRSSSLAISLNIRYLRRRVKEKSTLHQEPLSIMIRKGYLAMWMAVVMPA